MSKLVETMNEVGLIYEAFARQIKENTAVTTTTGALSLTVVAVGLTIATVIRHRDKTVNHRHCSRCGIECSREEKPAKAADEVLTETLYMELLAYLCADYRSIEIGNNKYGYWAQVKNSEGNNVYTLTSYLEFCRLAEHLVEYLRKVRTPKDGETDGY